MKSTADLIVAIEGPVIFRMHFLYANQQNCRQYAIQEIQAALNVEAGSSNNKN